MAGRNKTPNVVAELGRPETPAETAARKAETSRLYKQRKTLNNLVFSLLVTLGMVALIVLIVPRGTDQWSSYDVNVSELAAQSTAQAGVPLVAPNVPEAFKAKQAVLRSDEATETISWHINYTTANNAYAGVIEAFTATGETVNPIWVSEQLEELEPTGTETIGGLNWKVYDYPKRSADNSNVKYGLETEVGTITLLVFGTDSPDVIRSIAAEVALQADTLGLATLPTTNS